VTHVIVTKDGELMETSVAYSITTQNYDKKRQEERRLNNGDTYHTEESCSSYPLPQDVTLSYSRVKGFLYLPLETSILHNISTQYVFVSKSDVRCFGEPFLQFLVERILGVETVALNWLIGMTDREREKHDNHDEAAGYVYNPRTQQVIELSKRQEPSTLSNSSDATNAPLVFSPPFLQSQFRQTILFKAGVLLTSVFLFFITTTLVSFTLHETQERMLHFTFVLQEYVRQERPLASLIVKHVVENLVFVPIMVGVFFFLIEFYGGDKLLAFGVLTIVWVCQVFGIIAIRSIQGMRFFPKIFFLLFTLFHVYYFSCPFGFSYMALASTACFMLHSMVFFWHRYELPAVAHGLVTVEYPRMITTSNFGASVGIATQESSPATTAASIQQEENQSDILMVPVLDGATENSQLNRLHLPPRNASNHLNQQPNMLHQQGQYPSMSSLGRNSASTRPPSSTGIPFQGGDDDGDGSESYMYFMNGEVVMHRERNAIRAARSPSISTSGSLDQQDSAVSWNTSSSLSPTVANDSVPHRIDAAVRVVPDEQDDLNISVSTQEATNVESTDTTNRTSRTDSPLRQSPQRSLLQQEQVDSDLTPRIGSSSTLICDTEDAPLFPLGVSRDSR
jgi:hypothetical protein